MSKQNKEGSILHPLQRKIVLHLSKAGPQTINQTVKKIKHSYKPSWTAFNSLEGKGIIKKAGMKEHRNQQFPLFWLTEIGILTALVEGASHTELLTRSKEIYPNNQTLQYFIEMIPNFNPDVVRIALTALKNKGKLEPVDLGTIFAIQMETDPNIDKYTNALKTLKNYPKEHEKFKKQITLMQNNFAKLMRIIDDKP